MALTVGDVQQRAKELRHLAESDEPLAHLLGCLDLAADLMKEARKALGLLVKGNPNILSLLWLPDDLYISVEPAGRRLIESRALFATKAAYMSFRGYAASQLRKMTTGAFQGYMGEKRKRLVEKHGYDTKNAAHLIRLLRQGIEFLRTGDMEVLRSDADELLEIKHGDWTLVQVKDTAAFLLGVLDEAHAASLLPEKPDRHEINALAEDVICDALGAGL